MPEPGDSAVTKVSLLARTALDPSIPRHRFSDFPLDYTVMFCKNHSVLTGNITFQDSLLHILLSRKGSCNACLSNTKPCQLPAHGSAA